MSNGSHGDHPFTDIVHYGLAVFSESIDAAVREVSQLADDGTRRDLADRLLAVSSARATMDLAALERYIVGLRDRLRREATDRGWEPPAAPP